MGSGLWYRRRRIDMTKCRSYNLNPRSLRLTAAQRTMGPLEASRSSAVRVAEDMLANRRSGGRRQCHTKEQQAFCSRVKERFVDRVSIGHNLRLELYAALISEEAPAYEDQLFVIYQELQESRGVGNSLSGNCTYVVSRMRRSRFEDVQARSTFILCRQMQSSKHVNKFLQKPE